MTGLIREPMPAPRRSVPRNPQCCEPLAYLPEARDPGESVPDPHAVRVAGREGVCMRRLGRAAAGARAGPQSP